MRKVTAFLYYSQNGLNYEIVSFYAVTAKGNICRLIAPEHIAPYRYCFISDMIKSAEVILKANNFYVSNYYDFGGKISGIICLKVREDFSEEPQKFLI